MPKAPRSQIRTKESTASSKDVLLPNFPHIYLAAGFPMELNSSNKFKLKRLAFAIALLSILANLFLAYFNGILIFATQSSESSSNWITEFVGNYYMGDGLGLSCVFRINPDATFTIAWGTDTGHRKNYEGSISVENMRFVLTPNEKLEELTACFHRKVIPINWGDRKYLLPDDNDEFSKFIVSNFCKEIKSGDEPRNSYLGSSYLRSTDINISVRDSPIRLNGQLQCPFKQ